MKLLEDTDRARRLAAAILSDVALYNADAIASGGDLTEPVAEGRELYRSRTAEALHPLYEQLVAERGYDRAAASAAPPAQPSAFAAQPTDAPAATGLPAARPRFVVEPPTERRDFAPSKAASREQQTTDRVLVAMFSLGVLILGLLGALFVLR